ncbi:MAG: oligosaccharide flippase family protein [Solirubrobacteraceae bacterium]
MLNRLLRSATIWLSLLYAATGLAFMVANIVLARALSIADYAAVSLAIALIGFGALLGPLGQGRVIVRRNLAASTGLFVSGIATSALVGLGVAAVAAAVYQIDLVTGALLFLGATGHGVSILAVAKFQSDKRFVTSTVISQISGPLLLVIALLLAGSGPTTAGPVISLYAIGLVATAVASWWRLLAGAAPAPPYRIDWSEMLALTGISAMLALSATIERLLIPLVLSERALAEFAVLAALIIAPMRMLQMAVQQTLTPRLRDATSASARRRLLLHEGGTVGGLVAVLSLALWCLAPWAVPFLLGTKYSFAPSLILAAILSGPVRVITGFSMAMVTALSERERLHLVNCVGWIILLLTVPAAWIGAGWGLAGVVFGISAVWLFQAVILMLLVLSHFRGG